MREERAALLGRGDLRGAELGAALVELADSWLAGLLGDPGGGAALVAVGGLGRRELAPGSDLDLLLLHDGRRDDVAKLADAVWYPVWDSGLGLDHSVRTVAEAVAVSREDLKAALGLLDARHVAGDEALTAELVTAARAGWRADADRRLPELRRAVEDRAREHGEVAFLLEPDLKSARGGLRDVHALHAVAVAQRADPPSAAVRAAHRVLLDVRAELHRRAVADGRRPTDRLLLQEQDDVAAVLGHADADALVADVATAARAVAFASDTVWRRVLPPARPRRRLLGRRPQQPVRVPLADDVVEQDGEVVLARAAAPERDPVLLLRVAAAAARAGLPIAPSTLDRLVRLRPPMPEPWPRPALDELVALLAAGAGAVAVMEALDQSGVLVELVPEWAPVRSRPQRNSYHRFTVDRHLVEAAAAAAALTRRVARPDLLLLGALLHDIGKGRPGDHTLNGMAVVRVLAPRLGLPPHDVDVLVALVEHHLLLAEVATRRDLADPATARAVADAVESAEVLELLHALTEADSRATGPAAWSPWKARLVDELVGRVGALMAGLPPPPPGALADWQQAAVDGGGPALVAREDEVTVVAPDRPGLLSIAAGVLALHRLDVRSAEAGAQGSTAFTVFRVAPRYGAMPDWSVVQDDLRAALTGRLPLAGRLAAREAAYRRTGPPPAPPAVRLLDDVASAATVVEVRAADGMGVLHRITAALEGAGLDVRTAHISTLGADVVDAFYVVGPDGRPLPDGAAREECIRAVLDALATPGE
ncbi:MAG TPA: [protein-PII] uridylyltransferase [Mycobacteriales bacterium]|nr:[protein-PII] uridylyltransferase [Mycobacteriales bacterium]